MNYINLNGKIAAATDTPMPVDNGAFRYGYGLFETMLIENSEIRLQEYHWDRLFSGLKQLYFDIPALFNQDFLGKEVMKTVAKNKLEHLCRVRLQIFAAGGGLYSSESNRPGFIIECFPLEPSVLALNENGLTVGIASGLKKSIDSLSNLKSCNALIYAIAAKQACENKWNDALIINTNGNIIESTIANIFWVKDGNVYTPPLIEGCIAGVMRRHILEQIPVKETALTEEEILTAQEVFLSNSVRGIKWVACSENTTYRSINIKHIHNTLFSLKKT